MKILHINAYNKNGGAAIAVGRLVAAQKRAGHIAEVLTLDENRNLPRGLIKPKMLVRIYGFLSRKVSRFLSSDKTGFNSVSIFGAYNENELTNICKEYDIIHLHWVQNDQLTIKFIYRLSQNLPILWTLHDMWPIGSFQHYFDINRKENIFEYWYRSKKYSNFKHLAFIAPSSWMEKKIKIFNEKQTVKTIPNTLDEILWRPEVNHNTNKINDQEKKIKVFFAAIGGDTDPRKGADLLIKSLINIQSEIELLVVGGSADHINTHITSSKVTHYGHIDDEAEMRSIMECADVVVIPSRIDNLPNIALEAIMLKVPVVSFDVGGMRDLVLDGVNGALIPQFNTELLSDSILNWGRQNIEDNREVNNHLFKFREESVVSMHINYYKEIARKLND